MIIFKNLFEHYGQRLELNFLSNFLNSNKTTSIHILNADRGLNLPLKMLYYLLNKINNSFPYYKVDKSLEIRNFNDKNLKKNWSKCPITYSPSRKLSELFWINLPWGLIKRELNDINILDIGCGTGSYGEKFVDFSMNNINRYLGLDIKTNNNWISLKKKYSFFQFIKFDGKDFTDLIPHETNFFVTQSAVEHFEEDLTFFKQIRDYISSSRKEVIQIHGLPSKASLPLYRFHGVRQYTPRTISKIVRLFKDFSYSILLNLGGKHCRYLHYKYITESYRKKIGNMRRIKIQRYNKLSFNAIKKDMVYPQKIPSHYILIIHSNSKKKIL
ncbi:MAG: hypothetical protein ACFFCE_04410 [Promethearchaeota archaeon]